MDDLIGKHQRRVLNKRALKKALTKGHDWFRTWERVGQSHAGVWFNECRKCRAWYEVGSAAITASCEEVQRMDGNHVCKTGGRK